MSDAVDRQGQFLTVVDGENSVEPSNESLPEYAKYCRGVGTQFASWGIGFQPYGRPVLRPIEHEGA